MGSALCIVSEPEELDQGLFGQTFYYLLQLLPYLDAQGIWPQWEIRTRHYGDAPDYLTIPGTLDLAYAPPSGPYRRLSLEEMRRRHAHVLGGDWQALHDLWTRFFRIPERVLAAADAAQPGGRVLGVHYRGTDKQTATWDTNPISADEYLGLVEEFLAARPEFDQIFAATDEFSFVTALRERTGLPVHTLGEVEFHMAEEHTHTRRAKADRALLDCVLLSRCACVLLTSSALPSFAKLLSPQLEIYRCAASKLFGKLYTNMPYFPVAYIPVLPVHSAASKALLERTLEGDWTADEHGKPFLKSFVARPRWQRNHRVFCAAERLHLDRFVGRMLSGHR